MRTLSEDFSAFRTLPGYLQLTIATSFVFNCGFYLVIPFLATHMKDDLAFTGLLIGIVLGVRTFSQQGMFFLGGMLADFFGIKPSILIGCVVRIVGFLLLGFSTEAVGMIAGAVLTGFAGALFTPAIESAISNWAKEVEEAGGINRKEIWGLHGVSSQMGTVVGPGLGAALITVPFTIVCIIACTSFVVMFFLLGLKLPAMYTRLETERPLDSMRAVMANKPFLVFALINASYLVTYNQLYLALPADLVRQGAPGGYVSWYFMLASIMSIFGQMPLARLAIRLGRRRALYNGYVIMAAGFLPLMLVSPFLGAGRWIDAIPAIIMVLTLHIGFMISSPVTRDFVAVLARERHVATHMGVVGTMGGIGVLLSSTLTGWLLEFTEDPSLMSMIPWLVCMAFPLISAFAISRFPFPAETAENLGNQAGHSAQTNTATELTSVDGECGAHGTDGDPAMVEAVLDGAAASSPKVPAPAGD